MSMRLRSSHTAAWSICSRVSKEDYGLSTIYTVDYRRWFFPLGVKISAFIAITGENIWKGHDHGRRYLVSFRGSARASWAVDRLCTHEQRCPALVEIITHLP